MGERDSYHTLEIEARVDYRDTILVVFPLVTPLVAKTDKVTTKGDGNLQVLAEDWLAMVVKRSGGVA